MVQVIVRRRNGEPGASEGAHRRADCDIVIVGSGAELTHLVGRIAIGKDSNSVIHAEKGSGIANRLCVTQLPAAKHLGAMSMMPWERSNIVSNPAGGRRDEANAIAIKGMTSTTSTVAAPEKTSVGWLRSIDTKVPQNTVSEWVSREASSSCVSITSRAAKVASSSAPASRSNCCSRSRSRASLSRSLRDVPAASVVSTIGWLPRGRAYTSARSLPS